MPAKLSPRAGSRPLAEGRQRMLPDGTALVGFQWEIRITLCSKFSQMAYLSTQPEVSHRSVASPRRAWLRGTARTGLPWGPVLVGPYITSQKRNLAAWWLPDRLAVPEPLRQRMSRNGTG